ncbi:MAG: hypothetical protein HFK07_06650 [Clostridia bacterium]|jgi:hypothetical protein|nr:hypothetical protein [Clostridia bacterium]
MINVKDRRRSICVAALALLMLIAVSLLPFFPYETWAEGIDTRAITEEELSGIQREIESLYDSGTIIDAINEKQAEISGIQLMSEEIEKTVTISNVKILYDFNEKPTYLLTEFEEAGYAIRFREGETFVERNESFNSIYTTENVIEHRCYYAGPGQYFYKRDGKTYEVRTGQEVIFDKAGDDEIEEINRQIVEEKKYGTMPMSIIDEGYTLLNFNKKEMTMMDAVRGVYFYGLSEHNNTFARLTPEMSWSQKHDEECIKYGIKYVGIDKKNYENNLFYNIGGEDLLFGDNIYGSCAMVSIGMVLQLYDRTDWCDVVPSNTNAWERIQYDCPYIHQFANHPKLNTDKKDAERLHQYLISIAHPNKKPFDDRTYEVSTTEITNIINKYIKNLGYSNKIKGKNALSISVKSLIGKNGYPMIACTSSTKYSFTYTNEYGLISTVNKNGAHAFVVYGYKNSEYVCHLGWHGEGGYADAIINSRYIGSWRYIDIL